MQKKLQVGLCGDDVWALYSLRIHQQDERLKVGEFGRFGCSALGFDDGCRSRLVFEDVGERARENVNYVLKLGRVVAAGSRRTFSAYFSVE